MVLPHRRNSKGPMHFYHCQTTIRLLQAVQIWLPLSGQLKMVLHCHGVAVAAASRRPIYMPLSASYRPAVGLHAGTVQQNKGTIDYWGLNNFFRIILGCRIQKSQKGNFLVYDKSCLNMYILT